MNLLYPHIQSADAPMLIFLALVVGAFIGFFKGIW